MDRRIGRTISIVICVLLCLAAWYAYKSVDSRESADFSVHMLDFNQDLVRDPRDDGYRTTYEIFVYSFCDSDGDGVGDINGIRSRLDYIEDMGFDALWLTPVHPSATYHKYDVDDYYSIDPSFGTMEDYEALINECHERGILVYMDLVLNHTSEEHEWFRAAADYLHELPPDWDPDPSYCRYFDYYNFTRQPEEGYSPLEGTNWYYESGFWSEMPDLNLSSGAVREEIGYIMAYWLEKGVDGFRLDAVMSYYNNDPEANAGFLRFLTDTGRSIDPDCSFVGEAWTDRDTIAMLYGSGIGSLFDFPFAGGDGVIARTIRGESSAYDLVEEMIRTENAYREADPEYIDAPFYTNNDMARSTEYYPEDNGPAAKMSYAVNLLMRGNAFVYYGEELGMSGAGRDENYRAPMYWSDDPDGPDMCAGPPDMDEVHMKYPSLEEQEQDGLSINRWFREVIRVRNAFPVIARGTTENAGDLSDDAVAAFYRRSETEEDVLIVMNLRREPAVKDLADAAAGMTLAAVLNTGEEGILYQDGELRLPGFSIAVFNVE